MSDNHAFNRTHVFGAVLAGAMIASGATLFAFANFHASPAYAQDTIEVTGGEIEPVPLRAPDGAPLSFADLVERVSPAVVSVRVEVPAPDYNMQALPFPFGDQFPFPRQAPQSPQTPRGGPALATQAGSGFLINGNGYIVTNNHVVENGVTYTVVQADGTEMDAELIGTDPATDLAVLRIQPETPLPYVTFAEGEAPRVGDWVVAVGNPFGLGGTVTAGIVSARGRDLNGSVYNNFIQIDASINSGNSGGPTFDLHGRVIGVNTLIFSPSGGNVGIGFAIPSDVASSVVAQIIENGSVRRGWLGVQIQPVDEDVALSIGLDEARGAIINQVIENTPAARAGFERGDVVIEVNGEEIEDNLDLTRRVGAIPPGEATRFTVWRDGREVNLSATLDERVDTQVASAPDAPLPDDKGTETEMASDVLPGLTLMAAQDGEGVSVVTVDPDSEAASKGLRTGSVIVTVSGEQVSTPAAVEHEVEAATREGRAAILLLVREGEQERFVALRLDEAAG